MDSRRSFLKYLLTITPAIFSGFGYISKAESSRRSFIRNTHYDVKAGQSIQLPAEPIDLDRVHIIISSKSLRNPAKIKCMGTKVFGAKEDVKLDTLANITLVFNANKKSWELAA